MPARLLGGLRPAVWLLPALLFVAAPVSARAQSHAASTAPGAAVPESVVVTLGARYRSSGLHQALFGAHYRRLWTTPVTVEVLDLEHEAGGLEVLKLGGGEQTRSLRLRGGNGREYVFRTVDKDPSAVLPAELRGTLANRVVQDQISAAHPAGPLIVEPILDATGVRHAAPRLVVLPDSPRLGKYRREFAGLVGYFEERFTSDEATAQGAARVIGTDALFKRLERDPTERLDAPAFLAARLMDVFLGDWDRHRDQWRWTRPRGDSTAAWRPIPRDRDQALVRFDGLLLGFARTSAPQLVVFGPDFPGNMVGLTWNGRELDRRLLVGLSRATWDSTAHALQARLTDSVLEEAVRRLPPEYHAAEATQLREALRQRRDQLPVAAERFYRVLAREVDLHATDVAERAEITRPDDGGVTVAVYALGANTPYLVRRFVPAETDEVRLFLHGGGDTAIVRGPGRSGVTVRILGGGGADVLVDSARSGRDRFYDDPNGPARTPDGTSVDRRPYTVAVRPGALPPRDWGSRHLVQPWVSAGPDVGLFGGLGFTRLRYGFRRLPYASRTTVRAGWATGASTYRADLTYDRRLENSRGGYSLRLRASGIEVLRFHGFGNETSAEGASDFYRLDQHQYAAAAAFAMYFADHLVLDAGPAVKYAVTDSQPGRLITIAQPYGTGNFGMAGVRADLTLDLRDVPAAAHSGVYARVGGSVAPPVWDVTETFGEAHGEAATYVSVGLPLHPTLALRAGGKKVWGRYPFTEAAYIGGLSTVRLGREDRYAGDAAAWGNAELRMPLGHIVVLLPFDVGAFVLGDVGRVWLKGESSDAWHGAWGGGLSFAFLSPANTFTIAVTSSEERTGFYLGAGFAY